MGKRSKKVAYVVVRGHKPGLYKSWEECQEQVDGFSKAEFQGYTTLQEAQDAWIKHVACQSYEDSMLMLGAAIRHACPLQSLDSNSLMRARTTESIEPRKATGGAQEPTTRKYIVISSDDEEEPTRKRPKMEADFAEDEIKYDKKEPTRKRPKTEPDFSEDDIDFDQYDEMGGELDLGKKDNSFQLTAAQEAVARMAMNGHNIFLTGAAGSGKTATLKEILCRLRRKYPGGSKKFPYVQAVAPTGIAALPLNGRTTYSFAGWNTDSFQQPLEWILGRISKRVEKAIRRLKVLIIDEISMVEGQFLQRLSWLMQVVLESPQPFGGVQVIFLGDFHQISPVKPFKFCLFCGREMLNQKTEPICSTAGCEYQGMAFNLGDRWAFRAPAVWANLRLKHVKLEQIHRQKDEGFQDMLNKIRNGILLSDDEWTALTVKKEMNGVFPIRLMSLRARVEAFNLHQLSLVKTEEKVWNALDSVRHLNPREEDKLFPRAAQISRALETHKESLKDHRLPTTLALKVGAKVVLLSNLNIDGGLVNGSQGEVIKFVDTTNWSKGEWKGERWFREQLIIKKFQTSTSFLCPVVQFTNGKSVTIRPTVQECLRASSKDNYLVSRTQIPLALAWALSIHKSQGMTLEHVEVSSNGIFESGQLYVGLSRATKLEGLTVTGYSREQLSTDENVLEFYEDAPWEEDLESFNELKVPPSTPTEFNTEEFLKTLNQQKGIADTLTSFNIEQFLEALDKLKVPVNTCTEFKTEADMEALDELKVPAGTPEIKAENMEALDELKTPTDTATKIKIEKDIEALDELKVPADTPTKVKIEEDMETFNELKVPVDTSPEIKTEEDMEALDELEVPADTPTEIKTEGNMESLNEVELPADTPTEIKMEDT